MTGHPRWSVAGVGLAALVLLAGAIGPTTAGAQNVPVPAACSPQVNATLASLVTAGRRGDVDNVMVCGTTISSSRTQYGGRHGDHQILPLRVHFPDGSAHLIEVVTNDALDGRVTARQGAQVFALGQYFNDGPGQHFEAGLHDVHCATHAGADNGWVVVDGVKAPPNC
jgi:hypothetical protein